MAKKKPVEKGTFLKVIVFGSVVGLLLVFLGYRIYGWYQVQGYLDKADKIQKEANKELARLNQDFAKFQGDPASASKALPKFRQGDKVCGQAASKLKAITPPAQANEYHRDLTLLYSKSASFCTDLAKVADFIVKRGALLKDFASAVDSFDASVKASQSDEAIIYAAKNLKSSADQTLAALQKLKRPSILVYSNKTLEQNLSELSSALQELDEGINAQDSTKVKVAADKLKSIFERDWASALFEADKKGIKENQSRIKELETLKNRVLRERTNL